MLKKTHGKPGRPPKPKGEAKAAVLTLRLTDAERKAVEKAARRAALPVSEWSRLAIVAAANPSP